MKIEKIICDRCGKEVHHPTTRKIWLSKIGREGGLDLCDNCYNELNKWLLDKVKNPDVQIYIQALDLLRELMTKEADASFICPEYFEDDFYTLLEKYEILNEYLATFINEKEIENEKK